MCLNFNIAGDFKRKPLVKTFAIETSCDDTSIALIKFDGKKFEVEKMLSYSQTQEHKKYGGVVPEVASRLHEEKILILLEEFGKESIEKADFISVTSHPGLPGSLIVGIGAAYSLGNFLNKKIVEVNHIHGHIFSLFLERSIDEIKFPLVVLTASGGHNEIWVLTRMSEDKFGGLSEDMDKELLDDEIRRLSEDKDKELSEDKIRRGSKDKLSSDHLLNKSSDKSLLNQSFDRFLYTSSENLPNKSSDRSLLHKVGYTLDDAAGEAFDKVARMLGGPYPGGPWISEKSKSVSDKVVDNKLRQIIDRKIKPIFLSSEKFEFSFSGYKSQVYYLLQELEKKGIKLTNEIVSYIAYRFQEAVIEVLAKKLVQAAVKFGAKTIGITGGVSANDRLFEYLNDLVEKKKQKRFLSGEVKVIRPVKKLYSTDNAAMIGVAGILQWINIDLGV